MFDIAWSEILVIVVVALVVVGPKDLPRLMRTAGKWAGKARAMADQFRRSFDDMAREAEMSEMRAEMNRLSEATARQPMSDDDYRSFGIDPDTLPPRPLASDIGTIAPPAATPPSEPAAPEPAPGQSQT